MNKFTERATSAAILAGSLLFGASAYAVPISGSFELLGDPLGAGTNVVVATGEFTTGDMTTIQLDAYEDADGNKYNTIGITLFELVDTSSNFTLDGSNIFADFSLTDFSNGPVAVLAGTSPESVIGFTGVGANPITGPNAARASSTNLTSLAVVDLSLFGPNHPLAAMQPAQFTVGEDEFGVDVSGVQVIPEPSALALLGAGFLAFGAIRIRRARR